MASFTIEALCGKRRREREREREREGGGGRREKARQRDVKWLAGSSCCAVCGVWCNHLLVEQTSVEDGSDIFCVQRDHCIQILSLRQEGGKETGEGGREGGGEGCGEKVY